MTDAEFYIESRIITKGFMLAYEIDMFATKESAEKVLATSLDYSELEFSYSTIPGKFKGDNLPAILSATIPSDVRKKHPQLQRSEAYLIQLREILGSKLFFGGDSIGPIDLSLWGASVTAWKSKSSCFPGPFLTSDLMAWHTRVSEIMALKAPVIFTGSELNAMPSSMLINYVVQDTGPEGKDSENTQGVGVPVQHIFNTTSPYKHNELDRTRESSTDSST
jgi:hypothetical protein